jgi:hypothetical protein
MGFLISAVDEILRMEPLAHQAALHVDLHGQHGVDTALGDILLQIVECV